MTDRLSAILYAVLAFLSTALAATSALVLHQTPPSKAAIMIASPALSALFMWLVVWLMVRFGYSRTSPLDPALKAFFGRCLLVFAVWLAIMSAYCFLYLPLTGGALPDDISRNRLVLGVCGLLFLGLGNAVPKLPYQRYSHWLEIGPERTYRLNRIGGWLMVLVGAAEVICALTVPMTNLLFGAVAIGGLALITVPYGWLTIRYIRAYRQENLGA